ncbi:MAG: hypothetical protein EPO25_18465 [Gammaproteobacteria bacterium]|nr:MAG: hypothetical protein EPO25_18465 [Gammaproteobacteria bacterium]
MRLRPRALLRKGRSWLRRRQRRRVVPHAAVLMYHRVATAAADPWNLCVTPLHFDQQLQALGRFADFVPLGRLRERMVAGGSARPAIALTFDDGYRDNLDVALPILERHAAPATVFLVTDHIQSGTPFWWELLADLALCSLRLPPRGRLAAAQPPFEWSDQALAASSGPADPARQRLLAALWNWLVRLTPATRTAALQEFAATIGRDLAPDPAALPLTPAELGRLTASGLVQAGAHTCSHVRLTDLAPAAQLEEIAGSRAACARLTGRLPETFSYPFGELDESARSCVAQAGFTIACSSDPDLAWADGDPLRVPRIGVRDAPGEQLARLLRRYWFA